MAKHGASRLISTGPQVINNVIDDIEIEIAVAVEVSPAQTRAPVAPAESAGRSDIGKGSVPVVMVQDVRAAIGQRQVGKPVIVEIARRAPLAVLAVVEPRG